MRSMQLDERLQTVAELVRPGSVVADVGTDHGYLVCHLVGSRKCPRAFACDIAPGPLSRARQNIMREGLEARILPVQCPGLSGIPCDAVDDIVIAGMGGELIAQIILEWEGSRDPAKRFVLQPMTRHEHLRRVLYKEGFMLSEELAVRCGGHVYIVMVAQHMGVCVDVSHHFAYTGILWDREEWNDAACDWYRQLHGHCGLRGQGLSRDAAQATLAAEYAVLANRIEERLRLKGVW